MVGRKAGSYCRHCTAILPSCRQDTAKPTVRFWRRYTKKWHTYTTGKQKFMCDSAVGLESVVYLESTGWRILIAKLWVDAFLNSVFCQHWSCLMCTVEQKISQACEFVQNVPNCSGFVDEVYCVMTSFFSPLFLRLKPCSDRIECNFFQCSRATKLESQLHKLLIWELEVCFMHGSCELGSDETSCISAECD
jgi:hypothetical protein